MSDGLDPIGSPSRTCGTCVFFYMPPYRTVMGDCHRRPPTVVAASQDDGLLHPEAYYPAVEPTEDWCGEHRPRPAPNEPPRQGG